MSYTTIGVQAYAFIFIISTRAVILLPGLLIQRPSNATIGSTCAGYLANPGRADHRIELIINAEKNVFE